MGQVGEYLYGGGGPGAAFPVEPLIRFVNGEGALLANANGGPRMFFNIEDHTSWSTGQVDVKFQVRLPAWHASALGWACWRLQACTAPWHSFCAKLLSAEDWKLSKLDRGCSL